VIYPRHQAAYAPIAMNALQATYNDLWAFRQGEAEQGPTESEKAVDPTGKSTPSHVMLVMIFRKKIICMPTTHL